MNLFCCSMFRILARLSFQVYIWHFPIIYLLNGYKREPVFTNHLHHVCLKIFLFLIKSIIYKKKKKTFFVLFELQATLTIGMLVFTISLAFLIAVFYEYPCHKVVNYYYKKVILFCIYF